MPTESQPLVEETPPPPINFQNQTPVIPPPPMFSTTRRDSQPDIKPGKTILPPSVARRLGSNHPVIKQQTVIQQPTVTGNIFVPTFDSTPTPAMFDPRLPTASEPTPQALAYGLQMFDPNINMHFQDTPASLTQNVPPQMPSSSLPGPPKTNLPPSARTAFASLSGPESLKTVLPSDKKPPTQPSIFNPASQSTTPAIFTPQIPDPASDSGLLPSNSAAIFSQGPASLPPTSNIFAPKSSVPQTVLPPGPTPPTIGSSANIGPTLFTSSASNPPPAAILVPSETVQPPIGPPVASAYGQPALFTPHIPDMAPPPKQTTQKEETTNEPPKALIQPPKAIGTSNFRMTKKRPQYYSGPIEGIGSISNSIKPIIPTVDTGSFQGAMFTPEQPQADSTASSFDITKQQDTTTTQPPYDITSQTAFDLNSTPYSGQQPTYPSYDIAQLTQDYGQQYNTVFDLSRPTIESYEHKEEPKESKGFGIIGSLKSKLSSIDINKIQNSVTTFFDPAYNDTKKETPETQDNVPNLPPQPHTAPQYQGHTHNNFEIFVPNVEQSQSYGHNYQAGQNTFGQVNVGYPSDFNYHHNQSTTYADQNVAHQTYSTSYYSVPAQSLPQYQMSDVYSHETTVDKTIYEPTKSEENLAKITETADVKERNNKTVTNIQDAQNIQPVTVPYFDPFATNDNKSNIQFQQGEKATNVKTDISQSKIESVQATDSVNTLDILPSALPSYDFTQKDPKPTAFKTTDTKSLFEMTSQYGVYPTNQASKMPTDPISREVKSNSSANELLDSNVKSDALSSFGPPQPNSFLTAAHDNKETKPSDLFTNAQHDITKTKKAELPKKDNLLETLSKGEVPILGVSSVPLFGLSAIIPDKTEAGEEINVPLYDKTKSIDMLDRNASMSFFENFGTLDPKPQDVSKHFTNSTSSFFQKQFLEPATATPDTQIPSTSFFADRQLEISDTTKNVEIPFDCKHVELKKDIVLDREENKQYKLGFEALDLNDDVALDKDEVKILEDIDNVTELNICETCREVNKPEDKEIEKDDLTTQLIENITSPIQLANAVEVPLTEDANAQRVEFDTGQFEQISHITEETIETIHVQTATELLEDDSIKMAGYGWSVDESFVTNPPKHGDFNYTVGPNSISFFGDSLFRDNVPANASDELKAEFKHQADLLPKQINIPSAPPAEEDSKSDETGVLDVHSIELDAKEDFPVYEEFVIEPSETDDDKIEFKGKEKEESELDSFTNRVEKFKKMEEVTESDEPKSTAQFYEVPNQPISMASYFDTGNYAADTHYRNTMSSPSHVSIPPGFEEEFKKRLALAKAREGLKRVPDTQTQTKTTISLSFSTANTFKTVHSIMPVGFNVEANVTKLVEDKSDSLPAVSPVFTAGGCRMSITPLDFGDVSKIVDDTPEILPQAASIFATGDSERPEAASNLGSVSSIVKEKFEKAPQASSMFPSNDAKISEPRQSFGDVKQIFEQNPEKFPHASSIFASSGEPINIGKTSKVVEDIKEKMLQASSIFTTNKTSEVTSHCENVSNVVEDKTVKIPHSSFTGSSPEVREAGFKFGNISNYGEDKTEETIEASVGFPFGRTKRPHISPQGSKVYIVQSKTENQAQFAPGAPKMPEQPFSFPPASAEPSRLSSVDREEPKADKTPDDSNVFTFGDAAKPGTSFDTGITAPDKKPDAPKLPDPINFFSDTPAPSSESFNRLASYFNSPPKTDHAKSFFELSQSQNHYRHASNENKYHDLMKDLTSVQNLAVPTDQTIRHVNYFTVEYDVVSPEFSKGDSSKETFETDDKDLDSLSNCTFCNNLIYDKTCKMKTAMNDNSEGRNSVPNMENPSGTNRNSMSSILNLEGIQPSEEANEGVAGMTEVALLFSY